MENSGFSEYSNSDSHRYSMTFWQTFLLTLFGAAGLIAMVADGPRWITIPSFAIVIIMLLLLIGTSSRKKK